MIETLDTFVMFVKAQLVAVSATVTINGVTGPQRVGEVLEARDWPLTAPAQGAIYLLFQAANPLNQVGTQAQNLYEYHCQWVWLLTGQDLQANQQGANRGDRYRTNLQIMANLRNAHYPGYCPKKSYTADSQGNLTVVPVQSTYPKSNVETIVWTKPKFMPRATNDKSGTLYNAAAVSVISYEDVNPSIA